MSVYDKPYEVRDGSEFQEYPNLTVEYRDASHRYWIHHDGARVSAISVTSALKVLDKPMLLKWAEACGAEGAAWLASRGELEGVDPSQAIDIVRINGLGMEAKRDAGADRGTAVHSVLELWAREEAVPNLSDFPAEVRGYVQGLCGWLLAARPKVSGVERFVGSVEHCYAGRLDMRASLDGRDSVIDLKTSRNGRIYPEAHAQARAYALADVECGSPEPDRVVIVGVADDGSFSTAECEATAEDWLAILRCHRAMARLRSNVKATERAAA